jgi:cytochrome c biogenesis protein
MIRRTSRHLAAHFGSLRTTLALLALLAAVVAIRPALAPLALAIAALGANLLAALVVHPKLRRQLPLLVAHLALLALVLIIAAGRLMALDGRFELTQGEDFDGHLLDRESGPLYREALQRLRFRHEGFDIEYAPGRQRGATRNTVQWHASDGTPQQAVIGDHRPLMIEGHRIYTSPNKGFAPVLRWQADDGSLSRGAVHLPSYPAHELRQSREWRLPDGREVWVMLQFDETLIDPQAAARFRLPEAHRLVVRTGSLRAEIKPGESLLLDGGSLHYESLRTWMGYRITHDPTLPWLLAAALLASLAFALHYALAFRPGPQTRRILLGVVDG